jgi:hypothetical protein
VPEAFEASPDLMRRAGGEFSQIGDQLWAAWLAHLDRLPGIAEMFSEHPDASAAAKLADYQEAVRAVSRNLPAATRSISNVDDRVHRVADLIDRVEERNEVLSRVFGLTKKP